MFSSSTNVALDPLSDERSLFLFARKPKSKLAWFKLKVPTLDCFEVRLSLLCSLGMQRLESLALALLKTCSNHQHKHFYCLGINLTLPAPTRRQRSSCSPPAPAVTCCTWRWRYQLGARWNDDDYFFLSKLSLTIPDCPCSHRDRTPAPRWLSCKTGRLKRPRWRHNHNQNHLCDARDDENQTNLPKVVKDRSRLCGKGEQVGNGFLQTWAKGEDQLSKWKRWTFRNRFSCKPDAKVLTNCKCERGVLLENGFLQTIRIINYITGSRGGSRGGFFSLPSPRFASLSSPFFWSWQETIIGPG